jgi:ATP/maltotriose-dependent transcriptional regulator MalT
LSGAFASAEAVSIAGTQSAAADWLRWSEALPEEVATTLEWPVCRRRIEGLLLLRLGREREAVSRLQDAIECCERRSDEVQAAIGRVQLAEAMLRGRTASMIPRARTVAVGRTGAEQLRAVGVDPIRFAYAASRTFLDEEQVPERGGLTPREAQVLGRLAQGMTYEEIGKDLEINPRTVGVHASHCYEKLGVRNRVEAVRLAQDLGIV